jgi:hypothetical protein
MQQENSVREFQWETYPRPSFNKISGITKGVAVDSGSRVFANLQLSNPDTPLKHPSILTQVPLPSYAVLFL